MPKKLKPVRYNPPRKPNKVTFNEKRLKLTVVFSDKKRRLADGKQTFDVGMLGPIWITGVFLGSKMLVTKRALSLALDSVFMGHCVVAASVKDLIEYFRTWEGGFGLNAKSFPLK